MLCVFRSGSAQPDVRASFGAHRFGNFGGWNEMGCVVQQRWAKGSGLPLSRVDGFIEPPVTRQPAAACTVIWPEDEVLFNNCLTTIEVLRTLQACRGNSTCPEITLYLCASPLLLLFSGQQPTDTAWAQVETSLSAYQYTSLSVILHPRKSSLWGDAAGGWVSVHAAFRGRCFNLPDAHRCH